MNDNYFKTEREKLWSLLKSLNRMENAYDRKISDENEVFESDKNGFEMSCKSAIERSKCSGEIYRNCKKEYEELKGMV